MKINQLLPSVKAEVEKPFQEKLERARQLVKLFANRNACVSCSFGKDSTTVLYLCLQENPKIPVVFENTGVEFPETVQFAHYLHKFWDLNLVELKPEISFWQVKEHEKKLGVLSDGKKHKRDLCCYDLKIKPFKKYIKTSNVKFVFTGVTAVESRVRQLSACARGQEYYSRTHGITKIHPILYWTPEEVWKFIKDNNVPVNPAYAKYKLDRIGCVPCTSYKGWREQLARVNPRMYRFIQERFFGQKLLEEWEK